jgi:hypothetical protein
MASLPTILLTLSLSVAAAFAQGNPALTPAQRDVLVKLLTSVEAEAKRTGQAGAEKIAAVAREIDRNILSEKPDAELDRKLRTQLVDAVMDTVRVAMNARLDAVTQIVKVLTPDQKKLLLAELDKPGTDPDLAELVQKKLLGVVR